MAADAINGYLFSLKKHGELIPNDEENLFSLIDIKLAPVHA